MPLLEIVGNRFFAGGSDVQLQMAVVCCEGYPQNGWPLISRDALDLLRDSRINATHVRTGPFTRFGEPGEPGQAPQFEAYAFVPELSKYDLSRWNEAFWNKLAETCTWAAERGIYVEVDAVDHWVRQHGCPRPDECELPDIDPWNRRNNIQDEEHGTLGIFSFAPDPLHEAFIRKLVEVAGQHRNVLFSTGNEAFKVGPARPVPDHWLRPPVPYVITLDWEQGLLGIVKDELQRRGYGNRPVGSSSHDARVDAIMDYIIRHDSKAQAAQDKPVTVNEHADLPPEEITAQVRQARANGTYFAYFRGSHDDATWRATLAEVGSLRPPGR